jgi:hypothetical protein
MCIIHAEKAEGGLFNYLSYRSPALKRRQFMVNGSAQVY